MLLGFSVLVSFTTTAAAALCLQMEHHDPGAMQAGIISGAPSVHSSPHYSAGALGAESSPTTESCCQFETSDTAAVTAHQRALPPEPLTEVPSGMLPSPAIAGGQPALSDPALERRDHLAPSLTALSVSRT